MRSGGTAGCTTRLRSAEGHDDRTGITSEIGAGGAEPRLALRPQDAWAHLPGGAGRRAHRAGLRDRHQHRGELAQAEPRLGLRLPRQDRELRHLADVDRIPQHHELRARVPGRAFEHAARLRARHRAGDVARLRHRPRAPVAQLDRRPAVHGLRRDRAQRAAAAAALRLVRRRAAGHADAAAGARARAGPRRCARRAPAALRAARRSGVDHRDRARVRHRVGRGARALGATPPARDRADVPCSSCRARHDRGPAAAGAAAARRAA